MKHYTKIRQFYAWVGFISLALALLAVAYALFMSKTVQCTVMDSTTQHEPNLADIAIIRIAEAKEPATVLIATTTTPEPEEEFELNVLGDRTIVRTLYDVQVTGYNTVEEQTDSTPCIAANGENICGRTDTVACPSIYPLGTEVMIYGKVYECVDRTAEKFDGRFDINCNLNFDCPRSVTSVTQVSILN